jgi:hypothetical protein
VGVGEQKIGQVVTAIEELFDFHASVSGDRVGE